MSTTLTIRLTRELAAWLELTADRTGQSQGRIVRDALEHARATGRTPTFMRHAGAVKGAADLSTRKGFTKS